MATVGRRTRTPAGMPHRPIHGAFVPLVPLHFVFSFTTVDVGSPPPHHPFPTMQGRATFLQAPLPPLDTATYYTYLLGTTPLPQHHPTHTLQYTPFHTFRLHTLPFPDSGHFRLFLPCSPTPPPRPYHPAPPSPTCLPRPTRSAVISELTLSSYTCQGHGPTALQAPCVPLQQRLPSHCTHAVPFPTFWWQANMVGF